MKQTTAFQNILLKRAHKTISSYVYKVSILTDYGHAKIKLH